MPYTNKKYIKTIGEENGTKCAIWLDASNGDIHVELMQREGPLIPLKNIQQVLQVLQEAANTAQEMHTTLTELAPN